MVVGKSSQQNQPIRIRSGGRGKVVLEKRPAGGLEQEAEAGTPLLDGNGIAERSSHNGGRSQPKESRGSYRKAKSRLQIREPFSWAVINRVTLTRGHPIPIIKDWHGLSSSKERGEIEKHSRDLLGNFIRTAGT
ncbi:hypothetical protein JD844_000137 [Phrynosoma platyrhinos]|uniref:Uncharacterized protein n=1 Tax=Phrynosoma platyrhinos TaxID=52577 RepID=A0ABQ7SQ63_PHRPL|nr:hypothetical protein JD844_000137 [Phrynosoma platyrhinos]